MKKFLLLMMVGVLAACGAKPTDELGMKRAQRDSLKTAYAEIGVKIKDLETWLAEHDTTVKRNLPTVTALDLKVGAFTHYLDVHGNVKAEKAATLFSMGGGRVRAIKVKAGDHVQAGDMLVVIDNDVIQKQIAQAEAGAAFARTAYEKQSRLWDQKIGSEIQYLQAKTQKEQAEAGIAALREQLRLTNVTAPFAGTVDEIMARVGDMAAPGVPVARVLDLSNVDLEADIPESHLAMVSEGTPVKISFPSVGETFDAKLDHVGEFIDPANRTFKISVKMPRNGRFLRPNLLADVSIQDDHSDSAMVVPTSAVLEDVGGNNYVYVLATTRNDEATAHKVMVKRMNEYHGQARIIPVDAAALKGGETIADEGAKNLTDGQTVRVVKQ
jgi:RND family efflux transporter MFP subunit